MGMWSSMRRQISTTGAKRHNTTQIGPSRRCSQYPSESGQDQWTLITSLVYLICGKSKRSEYGPTKVLEILQDNSIFAVLDPEFVKQYPLETTETISPSGTEIEMFTVAEKPLYRGSSVKLKSWIHKRYRSLESGKTLVISSCAQIDQKTASNRNGRPTFRRDSIRR